MSLEPEQSFQQAFQQIREMLTDWQDSTETFARTLRGERIPHLSFSRLSSLEFCPQRYFLEYRQGLAPDPLPAYFEKGRLLHEIAAMIYTNLAKGKPTTPDEISDFIHENNGGEYQHHLRNAAHELQWNAWKDWNVVAVEQPFVIELAPDLPPCVGVIDLVLENEGEFAIIDHKSGRTFFKTDFYDPGKLQMSIYREYAKRAYAPQSLRLFYDKYRWVNDLRRIRKPAFEREEIELSDDSWPHAYQKLRRGYQSMREMYHSGHYPKTGDCYRCPFRGMCD